MPNCTIRKTETSFWLSFQIHGDGLELLEYGLPTPNHYQRANNASYGVYWLLDGYFHTKAGKEYLNDVIARLSIATKIQSRLGAPVDRKINPGAHRLSEFSGLPSLPRRSAQQLNHAKYDDAVFWAIKLESISRIRRDGWIDRDSLEFWAFDVFVVGDHVKDRSTLRAKVRSVFDWYQSRDWKIDDRSFTMSRSEAGRVTAQKNAKATEAKVRSAITSLEFLQEKITVSAVARSAGVSRPTAQKYLEKMGLFGQA